MKTGYDLKTCILCSKALEQPKYKLLKLIIDDIDSINMFTFFENYIVFLPEKVLPNSIFIMTIF